MALHPHHLQHLRETAGLSDAVIERASLSTVTDYAEAVHLLRRKPPKQIIPALRFPYDDTYSRLRPDTPGVENGGLRKYEAPSGVPTRIYIPDHPGTKDPSVPLFLLEGEKKALAGIEIGLAVAAAPGVDSFNDPQISHDTDERRLRPELLELVTPGRTVVILFDSDIDSNMRVSSAAVKLASMVKARGAFARIVYLPVASETKVGLDDYFVSMRCEKDAVRKIIEQSTRPTDPDESLEWIAGLWGSLSAEKREVELSRLLAFGADRSRGRSAIDKWIESATRWLDLPAGFLSRKRKEREKEQKRSRGDGGDWMDAAGYYVVASGPEAGVWKHNEDRPDTAISPVPVNITGVGKTEDGIYYTEIRFRHLGVEQQRLVPREELFHRETGDLTAKGGPLIAPTRKNLQLFLQRQAEQHHARLVRFPVFTRFGWSADAKVYIHGREVIDVAGGDARALVQASDKYLDALRPRGSRARYIDICREAIGKGVVPEMMWASAFAGPLLRLVSRRSLLISIWGQSGRGKSAVQALAMSAYGNGENLKITGDATPVAVEGALAQASDGCLWIDDTQQTRSRQTLDLVAYQIGGGVGRARGTVTGGIREVKDWTTIALCSGEHPLMQIGAAAGARNRTLELNVSPFESTFAAQIHAELATNHGHTAPEFIRMLQSTYIRPEKGKVLVEMLKEIVRTISPEAEEAAFHVAVLVLADYLARKTILGDGEEEARSRALAMGHEILRVARSASDSTISPVEAAYEAIHAFVAANDLAFEGGIGTRYGAKISPEVVDQTSAKGSEVVGITREQLNSLARKMEFNLMEVLHGLKETGRLIPGEGVHLARKTPEMGPTRPRTYWIVLPTAPADGVGQEKGQDMGQKKGQRKSEKNLALSEIRPTAPLKAERKGRAVNGSTDQGSVAATLEAGGTAGTVGHSVGKSAAPVGG